MQFHENDFVLRTKDGHDKQCDEVLTHGEHFNKTYGINRKPVLKESRYYHVIGGLPADIMHDILEGVLQNEVKELLKHYIKAEHHFALEHFNHQVVSYNLGYCNEKSISNYGSEVYLFNFAR